jgi:hypothetical protein
MVPIADGNSSYSVLVPVDYPNLSHYLVHKAPSAAIFRYLENTEPISSFGLAPVEQYIPMIISLSLWLLAIFLFYEGISFHDESSRRFQSLSKRTILGTVHLLIYSGIVTLFYSLIFVVLTAGWPNITGLGQQMTIILFRHPLIFVPVLMLLTLYPSMSAMLRFSGLDYSYEAALPPADIGRARNKFAARTGFFLSLIIFGIAIIISTACLINFFTQPARL